METYYGELTSDHTNLQFAVDRVVGSILPIKGSNTPFYVDRYAGCDGDHVILRGDVMTGGRRVASEVRFDDLSFEHIPLGYGMGEVGFISRIPMRQWKHGVRGKVLVYTRGGVIVGNGYDVEVDYLMTDLAVAFKGEYPSFLSALATVISGHRASPFSRNFCLVQGINSVLVEYKGDFIGTVGGVDSVNVTHDYVYMLEELKQVRLTMNLVDSVDLTHTLDFIPPLKDDVDLDDLLMEDEDEQL